MILRVWKSVCFLCGLSLAAQPLRGDYLNSVLRVSGSLVAAIASESTVEEHDEHDPLESQERSTDLQNNEEEKLPEYWQEELDKSIETVHDNIVSSGMESSTICFITDCHWGNNKRLSPRLVECLLDQCNINYFVNGGDLLSSHNETDKREAITEIRDCILAFRKLWLPMITLYGNHDRNRSNNKDHPESFLSAAEHANLVYKSFLPSPEIHVLDQRYEAFYWEDCNYRYLAVSWFYAKNREADWIGEAFSTDKPVVVLTHGIYYRLTSDLSGDQIDSEWILNAFEPYHNQIRCFIQGHTHRDGVRFAYGNVPIVIIDCDTMNVFSEEGTISEQSFAVITIDNKQIKTVKIGKGEDFTVTDDISPYTAIYPRERVNAESGSAG